MTALRVPVRFYRYTCELGVPCREERFEVGTAEMAIEPAQAAMILVDCWDRHYIETHEKRSGEIIEQKVAPAVEAARQAGVTIVQAPSPDVAPRYPLLGRLKERPWWPEVAARAAAAKPSYASWPPPEFVKREG